MLRPTSRSQALGAVPAVLALLTATLAACGGSADSGRQSASGPCASLDAPRYDTAVEEFLKELDPKPLRFLTAPTGDSALPGAAVDALQEKGPTFIFPADSAQRQQVLATLEEKGAYPTLLVLYGGTTRDAKGMTTVRFTGRFVDKDDAGIVAPLKAMTFQCKDGRWQFVSTKVDRKS